MHRGPCLWCQEVEFHYVLADISNGGPFKKAKKQLNLEEYYLGEYLGQESQLVLHSLKGYIGLNFCFMESNKMKA